ncbi:hypothetical protein PACTADRAFT_50654 [Pachysolen tannophilus NRRL Y-2460]|uniref:Ras-GAP domain-containing protein n=1 Tax=Pachysolen tannophilus NRRL Y-2460 TaxID=669874 RepID=A0A1E4TSR7_PACTA|nr:hypothetical protein PACTADRAFT_50654 [Pachysolen tannophilus NRRL Y-2460]
MTTPLSSPTKRGSSPTKNQEFSPLMSASRFNSKVNTAADKNHVEKENLDSSHLKKNGSLKENVELSPIKRLIMERENAVKANAVPQSHLSKSPTKTRLNTYTDNNAIPKLNYFKPNFQTDNSKTKRDIENMNRITSGMSQSPSMKNLHKLKNIESKLKNLKGAPAAGGKKSSNYIEDGEGNDKNKRSIWIDSSRKSAQTYEYLCRIAEAKTWLESSVGTEIDIDQAGSETEVIVQFADYLRNVKKIYYGTNVSSKVDYKSKTGFQFKYTENINYFFQFLESINMPDIFRFELTDLYDLKNFPKVILCLHALSFMLSLQDKAPKIQNLSGQLEFSEADISKTEANIRGLKIPNFDNIDSIDELNNFELEENDEDKQEEEQDNTIVRRESALSLKDIEEAIQEEPEDLFESDIEIKSEDEEAVVPMEDYNKTSDSIPADDYLTKKYKIDDIHKKYEHLINSEQSKMGSTNISFFPDDESISSPSYDLSSNYYNSDISLSLDVIIKLQAISRGSIFRYKMFVDRFMLKTFTSDIIQCQSIIRANLTRASIKNIRTTLNNSVANVSKIQSAIRNSKSQTKISHVLSNLDAYKNDITKLQSIIRGGVILRTRLFENKKQLLRATNQIIRIQSCIRSWLFRRRPSAGHEQFLKESTDNDRASRRLDLPQLDLALVSPFKKKLAELQSIMRGALSRKRLNIILDVLYYQESPLNRLAAISRGKLLREDIYLKKYRLQRAVNSIIYVQSRFRGVLARFEQDSLLDTLEDNVSSTIQLQSIIRGGNVRKSINNKLDYYNKPQNIKKIIKIQSYIRANKQGSAYKSLISMPDPPLSVVKRFIQLLNDNEIDFDDEINLQKLKDSIKRKSFEIGKLEDHLNQLDIKIELLMKNKITIDELIKHKSNHLTDQEIKNNRLTSSLINDLDHSNSKKNSFDKSTRDIVDLYGKFFYLLQTKSVYFVRLFETMEKYNLNYELEIRDNIEDYIMRLFNFSSLTDSNPKSPSREDFLLMKLIISSVTNNIEKFKNIESYKNHNKLDNSYKGLTKYENVWELILNNYNNLTNQRITMRKLFSSKVESVIADSDLDLESNPLLIYKSLIEAEEQKTGEPSSKPMNITPQAAIHDADTRSQFVVNLADLRELANDFMLAVEDNVDNLPIYIRCLCHEIYSTVVHKFPQEPERFHLSVIGKIFMKNYFLPLLLKPENYGINATSHLVNKKANKKTKRNLIEIAKVLYQLVSMRSFGSSNIYLQPLNDYIEQSVELVRSILKKIIDVKDIETCYDMNVMYDDIVSQQKPKLNIEVSDILAITKMINKEIEIISPLRTDILRRFLSEINISHASQLSKLDNVTLELIPSTEDENPALLKTKTIYLQVKRCILYIIQVQNGDDLLDLLLSKIEPKHEKLFKKIIHEEKQDLLHRNIAKPYSDGLLSIDSYDDETNGIISKDLTKLSYHELKRITLEKILELESMGELTRRDAFQKLLNEIANDIKNKHAQRLKLKREIEIASATLKKLVDKENSLQQQLGNYNKDIETAMLSLQSSSKSSKKNFLRNIFSRQYFYHRELKKNGNLPKFGSFKYSSKYLYENGILLQITGLTRVEEELSASGSSKIPKVDLMFSCDEVGIFEMEMAKGVQPISGGKIKISLDDLLNYQYENKKQIFLFNEMAKFDTNALISFIFRKFYEVKDNKH